MNHLDVLNDAVANGLRVAGLEDTTENRLKVLKNVHASLADNGPINYQTDLMLVQIENEVVRLEAL